MGFKTLPDYIERNCLILFVGLNPGLRSCAVQHHFAGYTNRFWKLMVDAGFLPEGSNFADDQHLPQYGWGITNLVSRATSGAADLCPNDYANGRRILLTKIRRYQPRWIAFVGLMVFREFLQQRTSVTCGLQEQTIHEIPVLSYQIPAAATHTSLTDRCLTILFLCAGWWKRRKGRGVWVRGVF